LAADRSGCDRISLRCTSIKLKIGPTREAGDLGSGTARRLPRSCQIILPSIEMANPSLPNLLKLIGINAVFLWTGIASAAVQNGTYFAFIYLPDYAAVAIDSRVISGGNVSDDMCKLFPLSERVIFFSSGVYAGKNSEGTVIFSPHVTAGEVFRLSSNHDMSDIVEQWAHTILEQIKGFSATNHEILEHNEDGFITRGVFAGESNKEDFVAYQSTITRANTSGKMSLGFTKERIPDRYFLGLGHPEVVEPILHNGPDEWGRKIHAQILAETAGITAQPERAATWVSAVTQAVIDRAGDHNIGGKVASIILERGHNWRWFRRPDFCPEH